MVIYIKEKQEVVILRSNNLTNTINNVKRDLPKYLEKEFINSTINTIKPGMERMLLTFLWMSGVRITEAINLRKSDIDFNNRIMTLKWLKSRKYNFRQCPIHSRLSEVLRYYIQLHKQDQRVFPISRQRAWQITKRYLDCSPHQLRHSFAVNWLRNKGDIVLLHRILGHSKIQTTMEYLKIVPQDQAEELEKINFW